MRETTTARRRSAAPAAAQRPGTGQFVAIEGHLQTPAGRRQGHDAFDPSGKAVPGKRSRRWTAVHPTEVECEREMARCLRSWARGGGRREPGSVRRRGRPLHRGEPAGSDQCEDGGQHQKRPDQIRDDVHRPQGGMGALPDGGYQERCRPVIARSTWGALGDQLRLGLHRYQRPAMRSSTRTRHLTTG